MFNYAQIDEYGYCVCISSLSGIVVSNNMILIDEYDISYLNRKYDIINNTWTDEYFSPPQMLVEEDISMSEINKKLDIIMKHLNI